LPLWIRGDGPAGPRGDPRPAIAGGRPYDSLTIEYEHLAGPLRIVSGAAVPQCHPRPLDQTFQHRVSEVPAAASRVEEVAPPAPEQPPGLAVVLVLEARHHPPDLAGEGLQRPLGGEPGRGGEQAQGPGRVALQGGAGEHPYRALGLAPHHRVDVVGSQRGVPGVQPGGLQAAEEGVGVLAVVLDQGLGDLARAIDVAFARYQALDQPRDHLAGAGAGGVVVGSRLDQGLGQAEISGQAVAAQDQDPGDRGLPGQRPQRLLMTPAPGLVGLEEDQLAPVAEEAGGREPQEHLAGVLWCRPAGDRPLPRREQRLLALPAEAVAGADDRMQGAPGQTAGVHQAPPGPDGAGWVAGSWKSSPR